jgi:hypothetical protein
VAAAVAAGVDQSVVAERGAVTAPQAVVALVVLSRKNALSR